jgi:hypothetical protein
MKKKLTVGQAIRVQQTQLNEWKKILYPETYIALEKYATKNNAITKNGNDICQGKALQDFVYNYKASL